MKTSRTEGPGHAAPSSLPLSAALEVALSAHGDQRYGLEPYGVHLREVMGAVRNDFGLHDELHLAVAALHDVLEDTPLTQSSLEALFGAPSGSTLAQAVSELSRRPDVSKQQYFDDMGDLAFTVKLADRLSNLRHHGRPKSAEEAERQRSKLYPKYLGEQTYLEARAKRSPQLAPFVTLVRRELALAAARLDGLDTFRPAPGPGAPRLALA